jgi:hypothetical protein
MGCPAGRGDTDRPQWEETMYQRLVFDLFSLSLWQKREIASRLGLGGLHAHESDFEYSKRLLREATENEALARLAELVRGRQSDLAA